MSLPRKSHMWYKQAEDGQHKINSMAPLGVLYCITFCQRIYYSFVLLTFWPLTCLLACLGPYTAFAYVLQLPVLCPYGIPLLVNQKCAFLHLHVFLVFFFFSLPLFSCLFYPILFHFFLILFLDACLFVFN